TKASVVFVLQIVAHERKNLCSGVNPSINPGLPLSCKYIFKASKATELPPKSPMFSPNVKRPFTNTPGTGSYFSNCATNASAAASNFLLSSSVHQLLRFPSPSYWEPESSKPCESS